MRANTTPMDPYFLSSEITLLEKMNEKTTSIPIQQTAVAIAEGNRSRQVILPPNNNHIVNHQKRGRTTRPTNPSSPGPPVRRSQGPPELDATAQTMTKPSH